MRQRARVLFRKCPSLKGSSGWHRRRSPSQVTSLAEEELVLGLLILSYLFCSPSLEIERGDL